MWRVNILNFTVYLFGWGLEVFQVFFGVCQFGWLFVGYMSFVGRHFVGGSVPNMAFYNVFYNGVVNKM